jgi:hypothetical protein
MRYPITRALTVIQTGLDAYPSFASFRHPDREVIHMIAVGPVNERGKAFSQINLKKWQSDTALCLSAAQQIVAMLLPELGIKKVADLTDYSDDGSGMLAYTPEPSSITTAHEKIDAVVTISALLPKVMQAMPELKATCPDLFKPTMVST